MKQNESILLSTNLCPVRRDSVENPIYYVPVLLCPHNIIYFIIFYCNVFLYAIYSIICSKKSSNVNSYDSTGSNVNNCGGGGSTGSNVNICETCTNSNVTTVAVVAKAIKLAVKAVVVAVMLTKGNAEGVHRPIKLQYINCPFMSFHLRTDHLTLREVRHQDLKKLYDWSVGLFDHACSAIIGGTVITIRG